MCAGRCRECRSTPVPGRALEEEHEGGPAAPDELGLGALPPVGAADVLWSLPQPPDQQRHRPGSLRHPAGAAALHLAVAAVRQRLQPLLHLHHAHVRLSDAFKPRTISIMLAFYP